MGFKTKMGNCIKRSNKKHNEGDALDILDDTKFRHNYQPEFHLDKFYTFKCEKCDKPARSTREMIISNIKPKCPCQ